MKRARVISDGEREMAEPRKVFRIERTAAARMAHRGGDTAASPHRGEVMRAFSALQAMMAASATSLPTGSIAVAETTDGGAASRVENTARIAQELDAVIAGSAQATQKILAAAEQIDELANNLSAALKGHSEQGLAQDISDIVIRIFEACNFQDLISQRVAKVMKALRANEAPPRHSDDAAPELHGPQLPPDKGHLSQSEIDALFC